MGHVQRARLKGFARLRAILWRRSLRLYEAWALRHLPWVRPLYKELGARFRDLDLDDPARCGTLSDVFGETPIVTVVKLLEILNSLSSQLPSSFVDLGSGRGQVCLVAAHWGYQGLGYEKESDWCHRSQRIADKFDLNARFEAGDFFLHEWPSCAVYFVVATAFSRQFKEQLEARFSNLSPDSLLVVGDWTLEGDFQPLWSGRLPVDWGVIPFTIYCSSESGAMAR